MNWRGIIQPIILIYPNNTHCLNICYRLYLQVTEPFCVNHNDGFWESGIPLFDYRFWVTLELWILPVSVHPWRWRVWDSCEVFHKLGEYVSKCFTLRSDSVMDGLLWNNRIKFWIPLPKSNKTTLFWNVK